jgi:hypothetical protein
LGDESGDEAWKDENATEDEDEDYGDDYGDDLDDDEYDSEADLSVGSSSDIPPRLWPDPFDEGTDASSTPTSSPRNSQQIEPSFRNALARPTRENSARRSTSPTETARSTESAALRPQSSSRRGSDSSVSSRSIAEEAAAIAASVAAAAESSAATLIGMSAFGATDLRLATPEADIESLYNPTTGGASSSHGGCLGPAPLLSLASLPAPSLSAAAFEVHLLQEEARAEEDRSAALTSIAIVHEETVVATEAPPSTRRSWPESAIEVNTHRPPGTGRHVGPRRRGGAGPSPPSRGMTPTRPRRSAQHVSSQQTPKQGPASLALVSARTEDAKTVAVEGGYQYSGVGFVDGEIVERELAPSPAVSGCGMATSSKCTQAFDQPTRCRSEPGSMEAPLPRRCGRSSAARAGGTSSGVGFGMAAASRAATTVERHGSTTPTQRTPLRLADRHGVERLGDRLSGRPRSFQERSASLPPGSSGGSSSSTPEPLQDLRRRWYTPPSAQQAAPQTGAQMPARAATGKLPRLPNTAGAGASCSSAGPSTVSLLVQQRHSPQLPPLR